MEYILGLGDGFSVALLPINLLYVTLGVAVGTFIGALPGLGPATVIAMLLPLSFGLPPETAIIFLAGIFLGSMYGGRIPSILLNLPGDAPSVVTTFDGYPMAKQGRAGVALTVAAVASFIGATIGILALTFLAPPLASFALRFGPPEITVLTLVGVLLISYLGVGSFPKSLCAAGAGFLLASIGQDPMSGEARLTLGNVQLLSGLDFIVVIMGIFGLGEMLYHVEQKQIEGGKPPVFSNTWPKLKDWTTSQWAMIRGGITGLFIGITPGVGAEIASMTAYGIEKRRSPRPQEFGHGAIQGVASPESANNSATAASFIPLLTLGIPGSVTGALIFGALLLQGITPGPTLISDEPTVFYGLIASLWIGNIILLIINIPLVGVFVKMLRIRLTILVPIVVCILLVGAYSVNNRLFDIWILLLFGVIGFLARKGGFNMGAFALAYVLSPIIERAFRQSLILSDDGFAIFFSRPVSASIIAIAICIFLLPPVIKLARKRARSAAIDK